MAAVRVAALQLQVGDDRERNLAMAGDLIDSAVEQGARLIVLPELFAVPFVSANSDPEYFLWAEPTNGPSNNLAAERSRTHGVTVVTSFFEAGGIPGTYYNASCTFVNGTLAAHYRKSHLPFSNQFPEKFYFRPGDAAPAVTDVGWGRIGTIICYERHFPELGRLVALQGAEVMCVPVACASAPTRDVFLLELRAHAAFNSMYVIAANRTGIEGSKAYYGSSVICAPDGQILAKAGDSSAEALVVDIDLDAAVRRRQTLPFFRDRRPELYAGLSNPADPTAVTVHAW
jgi:beta-ureidopropionase